MAVFRVEKTKDYTVMANHHLRNKDLSLKAKGLLSLMLSLPEDWDYTTKGLAHICKDGVDSICAGVRELEEHGYVVRERVRNTNGQLGSIEYTILEQPKAPSPKPEKPERENPVLANPILDKPVLGKPEQENTAQLNIDITNTQKPITDSPNIDSFHSDNKRPSVLADLEAKRKETNVRDIEIYREIIRENISYDILFDELPLDRDRLEEILELLTETVCSTKKYIRVAGTDYPAEMVRSRLLKLDMEHIKFVFDCLKENTTKIRNIKQYLLTTLYNAPTTIGNYYSALVQHDLYGDSSHDK